MGNERQKVTCNSEIVEIVNFALYSIYCLEYINLNVQNNLSAWWPLSGG